MNEINIIQKNKEDNDAEVRLHKIRLRTTPQYITIGAHAKCNANCVFCLGGDFPNFSLQVYKDLFENRIGKVLKKADHIGFCGFGEIFLIPEFINYLEYINIKLPDNTKVFTTNGISINSEISDIITDGKYSLLISLHAADKKLHESMTRTKAWDKIISNIKKLIEIKKIKRSTLHINLIFLATTINIENLPDFIKLAKQIGVDTVTCNYLTIFNPDQIKLSCFFNPEKTNKILKDAEALALKLNMSLNLPPKFGIYDNKVKNKPPCYDPWNFFYVETQGSVNPCCFAGNHIGYLEKQEFYDIWNGPGYTKLREGLINDEPHSWCRDCYRYDLNNINNIKSHITFRPEAQAEILLYLEKHKNEYPISNKKI
ncbi:MAG: SPASM domain-containing protein [Elusimicrobia bacterium]|nr:SPASM domain-containing protein [Candidatus Liberimonas magnetica]